MADRTPSLDRALPRCLMAAVAALLLTAPTGCGRKPKAQASGDKASATAGSAAAKAQAGSNAAAGADDKTSSAEAAPEVDPGKRAEAAAIAKQARREAMDQPRPLVARGNEALARQRDRRAEPPRELVRHLRPIIRYKDVKSLKRYCSDRLAATLDDTVSKHGDRFWKHLAKYGDAFDGGYAVELGEADAEGRVPATVRGKDGLELRPVLIRGAQGFVFDRF